MLFRRAYNTDARAPWLHHTDLGSVYVWDGPNLDPEAVLQDIVEGYRSHLRNVFPTIVLKGILDMTKPASAQRAWGGSELDEVFFACLDQPDMPTSFGRKRLERVKVDKVPSIVPFYLKRYLGAAYIQRLMREMKDEFGFYEEFDWDEFRLGVFITADSV
ncbi:hypothetical protein B0T16DRAFT_447894 [Cercophora newfieldiana]|uniref:Uncharacterized protein n=1 Tax=Cercophora newfieldiana TaxID=92897 RepID=A0AA39Y3E5_9PEZI|nr:hypothetical protein B0T16DRAFT_447894 [Cercophora newfieldiana]